MQEATAKWIAMAAVAAAIAAIALVVAVRSWPAPSAAPTQAVLDRLEAMQERADARDQALRRDLERLQRQVGAPARRDPAVEAAPASPQARQAELQAQADAQRKRLEVVFAGQGAAPARDAAPREIETAFEYPGVLDAAELPLAEDVQCRARMCLIRARFGPHADGSDWATRVLMEVATTLPDARIVSVPLPGGSTELRIYAARAGVRDPFATVP